jgi:hypothetical protein
VKCRTAEDCRGRDPKTGFTWDYGACDSMIATRCKEEKTNCDKAAYGGPPAAPIATLPAAAPAIVTALNSVYPNGETPTRPALEGAVEIAKAHATANAERTVIVVLATDGLPTGCNKNAIADSAGVSADGLKQGIKTFVVGVFSPGEAKTAQSNLDQISSSGGTGNAFVINTNQNVAQAFQQALDTIRRQALACEFSLPKPEAGTPDYSKVNVQYTPSSGKAKVLPAAANVEACNPADGGWYYDVNPTAGTPTKVTLCPASCDKVKNDPAGKIEIVQGCKTVVLVK